ncbi:hypothetical protein NDU88_007809 [Pleurodeles waltl]|uniref:Uncharacterized protein n=1 Tax=Pleurodeles waltl TaxID=8319 RepID=A0AAV7VRV1_PLEWA|nr:hypothetical protein NDU88_007809 [Pleurodeles waltl]
MLRPPLDADGDTTIVAKKAKKGKEAQRQTPTVDDGTGSEDGVDPYPQHPLASAIAHLEDGGERALNMPSSAHDVVPPGGLLPPAI